MANQDKDNRRELRRGIRVLAISWVMALAILAGWLIGGHLDQRIGWTFPWLTVLGIVAGVAGGGWFSYRTIMKAMRE